MNVECANSKQQESAKQASSGSVTPGASSQPSPPMPQSSMSVTASAASATSATDMKAAGLTEMKEEVKTPGLASLSSGNIASTSSGFGFNVSLDKEETKVGHLATVCHGKPSIHLGSVNEYRLRLGRYKAGMCDAAWCAPCT